MAVLGPNHHDIFSNLATAIKDKQLQPDTAQFEFLAATLSNLVLKFANLIRWPDRVKLLLTMAMQSQSGSAALNILRGPGLQGSDSNLLEDAQINLLLPSVDALKDFQNKTMAQYGISADEGVYDGSMERSVEQTYQNLQPYMQELLQDPQLLAATVHEQLLVSGGMLPSLPLRPMPSSQCAPVVNTGSLTD